MIRLKLLTLSIHYFIDLISKDKFPASSMLKRNIFLGGVTIFAVFVLIKLGNYLFPGFIRNEAGLEM